MKLVFATNNKHKFLEIRNMLPESYELLTPEDLGYYGELPETHDTLEEKAAEKAVFIWNKFGYPCFADDSGLEVMALGGKPGVFSARYAGENKDDLKNMQKLLNEMKSEKNREARFRTVIALVKKNNPVFFEGILNGSILHEPAGSEGFGYDPVFKPEISEKSLAQMSLPEKNRLSHRARAVSLLINYLKGPEA